MTTKLRYTILPARQLILERLEGPVAYTDLVSLTETIWADEAYDRSYKGIIDIRWASIDMTPSSVSAFAELILASESASEGRVALLSSKPVETALSVLLAERLAKGQAISVFSTWEGVAVHLGLSEAMRAELADERAYDALFG